jgi:hypothetical protein
LAIWAIFFLSWPDILQKIRNFQQKLFSQNVFSQNEKNSPPKKSPVKPIENWTSKKNLPSAKRRK